MVSATTPPLLTAEETADLLGIAAQTLAIWRCKEQSSLPFVRVGRCIRYRPADVEAFIAANTVRAADPETAPC